MVIVPLLTCILLIIGVELLLRVVCQPDPLLKFIMRLVDIKSSQFELDDEMGYRPILGKGLKYSEEGIFGGQPTEKTPGKTRILFIGDSVTARGKIIRALTSEYKENFLEVLNAGVEGFNVIQEVKFYRRYNKLVHPDIVVLTLHNNDLEFFPALYKAKNGSIFYYLYDQPTVTINPTFEKWSRLYQKYTAFRCFRLIQDGKMTNSLFRDTRLSLQSLNGELVQSGAKMKVLLLPILAPLNDWTPSQIESRKQALQILNELGIEYFDLLEPLVSALQTNTQLTEKLGDTWHPNDVASGYFARYLKARHFLN